MTDAWTVARNVTRWYSALEIDIQDERTIRATW
jgi:hypothetical protein